MNSICYHCNEHIPKGFDAKVVIDGTAQPMCCIGCEAVAQTIVDNNLTDYYKFRTEPAQKSALLIPEQLQNHQLLDDEELQNEFTYSEGELKEAILTVEGISCAACAWLIEKQLNKLSGIASITVNATSQRATIKWAHEKIQLSEIVTTIDKIGYQALPFKASTAEINNNNQSKSFIKRLGVSGILMMQVMMIAVGLYFGAFSGMEEHNLIYLRYISMLLATPIILYGAYPFYIGAYKAIKAHRLSMDVPVSIAILLAYSASCWATLSRQGEVYFESVSMFTFLLLIGKFLEFRARSRAAQVSANLLKLMPMTAIKLENDKELVVSAKKLLPDDKVMIKPGETIPADGLIIKGKSQLNEAMLTGEHLPITKTINDTVFAGTINGDSNLLIRVTKKNQESFLSQLIRLSEQSQSYKPKLAILSDKIAQYFVALILLCATFAALYWWQHSPNEAFWIALSILVATCPCALSLATPTALTCATTRLNNNGIMIKSSHVIETLPQISSIAFDKTGTLTLGKFNIKNVIVLDNTLTTDAVLAIAACLESASEHPIAKAFVQYRDHQIKSVDLTVHTSKGITGTIDNSYYQIGKPKWLFSEELLTRFGDAQCVLIKNNIPVAVFYMEDTLREEAHEVLSALKENIEQLLMLSGDNQQGCDYVASQLPIDEVHSALSAEDKMSIIQQNQHTIAMVGDGVNDTPVFSAAHVSFAMGSGTDIAKNGADVILLNNKLTSLLTCLHTAKKTKRIIIENYCWAFGYNAIVLPLAIMGMITPYMAVIGMSASSILVITNSLRLLKK